MFRSAELKFNTVEYKFNTAEYSFKLRVQEILVLLKS